MKTERISEKPSFILKGGFRRYNPQRILLKDTAQVYLFDPNATPEWWYDNAYTGKEFIVQFSKDGEKMSSFEVNTRTLTLGEIWVSKKSKDDPFYVTFTYSYPR